MIVVFDVFIFKTYFPSKSVDVPLDVLFTTTDTPGRKLPISSTTCPETRTVCEHKKLVMNTNTTGNNFKNNTLNLFMIIF